MKVGFDLQEVERIKDEEALLSKIANQSEIDYISKFKNEKKQRVASLWSVKEAVFKALDIKEGEISFKEIVLKHKENGAPFIELLGKAMKRFEELKYSQIEVSISHQKSVVGAVVVIV